MNLLCGSEYEMNVFAFDGSRNGSRSQSIKVRTAPCDPQDVKATSTCQDDILSVSWIRSAGAVSYVAAALGSSGVTYNCSSSTTSCQISGLQCGESLSVSVIAYDDECASEQSVSQEVVTAPCAPRNISAGTDCVTPSALIQWGYTEGAILYVVHANASGGVQYTCESFDLSCSLTGLPCGETYLLSVTASNYQCQSSPSQPAEFKTAPCIPKNVTSDLNCGNNTLRVTWSKSTGNLTYKATAKKSGAGYYNCTSRENYCEMRDIGCGQLYSVSVRADNGQCTTRSNWTAPFYSVPCKPPNVAATSICSNDSMEISWTTDLGLGTDMYVATLQYHDGQKLTCQSTSKSCVIHGSKCGQPATATVTAIGNACQSPNSDVVYTDPAPCAPMNLSSHVTSGLVVLSWTDTPGAVNYTAEIVGVGGEKRLCPTPNKTCSLLELTCGYRYNMTVTAAGRQCRSKASDTHVFQTAPCPPQNVVTRVDCVTNIATVSWNSSRRGENYTSLALGANGERYECNSTSTSCDVIGLKCGLSYSVTVAASNEVCRGEPSLPVELQTAPCVPELVAPTLSCESNVAAVSWGRVPGAMRYIADVTGSQGQTLSCRTANTSCVIGELRCGRVYNVTVTAINADCQSDASAPARLIAVPCQPENVAAQVNCTSSVARLSWNEAPGAVRYASTLRLSGDEPQWCNTTELGCEISGLQCGQTYNVTVTAFNTQCGSARSAAKLHTVPCVPGEVVAAVTCESGLASLLWAATRGAVNYTSVVTGPHGERHYCQASNTSCSIRQLACGVEYDATVVAVGDTCSSDVGAAIKIQTG
ncbi:hypothetical protein FKM82_020823 [Ascaphus truei]